MRKLKSDLYMEALAAADIEAAHVQALAIEAVRAEGFELDERLTIRSPGRFEAEPWWIVNVEAASLNGDGEDLSGFEDGAGEYASIFEDITPEERADWDLSADTVAILYTVSDQGFASVEELPASELDRVRARAEENAGPSQGDYIISDSRVSVFEGTSRDLSGTFSDDDEALRAIRERMDRDHFFPNVWTLSDHGNLTLLRDPFSDLIIREA